MFKKYQHIARLNDIESEGILEGLVYTFPKIDGTNASLWWENGHIHCGSRRKELSLNDDNYHFYEQLHKDTRFIEFFQKYPHVRIFGEFLVPHQIKYYEKDAWKKFYVFDVVTDRKGLPEDSQLEKFNYIPYELYVPMLEEFGIEYIPLLNILQNPTNNQLIDALKSNQYLLRKEAIDEELLGEGIVIKNYSYINRFGRKTWAKLISDEFLNKKHKSRRKKSQEDYDEIIDKIINKYVTVAFIEKEYTKMANDFEIQGKNPNDKANKKEFIGRFLVGIYRTLLEEELYNIVKQYKNPTIDFHKLRKALNNKIKETIPDIFTSEKE